MRYKEFVPESIDTAMRSLIGGNATSNQLGNYFGSIAADEPANTTGQTSDPGQVTQTTPNASGLPVNGPISSKFGQRERGWHPGTDFAVPVGTPVQCPEGGTVTQAGPAGNAGIMVTVNTGSTQHRFMHLSQVSVRPGDQIKAGQVIGLSGNTGLSTGPHLHWEKIVAGRNIDPMSNVG